MRLEHKAGIDIIYELAVRLYPSSLESFREAISNALDEGSRKVEIMTSLREIIVEDWGEGIRDPEKFAVFGEAAKAKLGGEIIGEKGLGKLSLLRLAKNIDFRSNNGEFGLDIIMTPEHLDYTIGSADKFLSHKGTRIVIPNPLGVPPIDELSNYLKKAFGLRITSGSQIILNGTPLESKSKIDSRERLLFRLRGGIDVTGNIKEDKKAHGSVDVYIKHVFVALILVDPERRFAGWVNCNELTPTTARNDVVKDDIYDDFFVHLKQYATRFPKIEEEISKEEILIGNELNKLLKNYLSDMKILPQGMVPLGKGKENALDKQDRKTGERKKIEEPSDEPEYIKLYSHPKTNKPIKRTMKTNYGVMWADQDYGNDKEPIFFVEPNLVVKNRTNDLYKFAIRNKPSLGPKWLRMFPYLARVAVNINPESSKWNREQLYLEMDKAIRYFLKNKDML